MTIKESTLRPGLLVSLKTSVVGNVSYTRRVIKPETKTESGTQEAVWETERVIIDPDEHEAAKKARQRARALITQVCTASAFGLLCPEDTTPNLEQAISDARSVADAFNEVSKLSRIYIYVITGRIASDDVEAMRAINSEVRDLLDDMEQGTKNLDVKSIREAAARAKNLGSMLSPDAAVRLQLAIDAARGAARKIVAAGEQAAQEIDVVAVRRIKESRTAFLDLDDAKPVAAPAAEARALDLAPAQETAPTVKAPKKGAQPALEF